LKTKGILLQDALQKFDSYISFHCKEKSFCILTDGAWDLKLMLWKETHTKGIPLAPYFRRFLNLKTLFSHYYKMKDEHIPLKKMSQILQTSMERHHSGIDDCRTIANILTALLMKGFRFSKEDPEVIPEDYDPAKDPEFVKDFNNTFVTKEITSPALLLRGLPYTATEKDICEFFSGLKIKEGGITFQKNSIGQSTGIATVTMDSIEEAKEAMKRHQQKIGKRYIEIFPNSFQKIT